MSWSTSYFPFQQFGMKLKFVDIDENTLNYNMIDLKNSIRENKGYTGGKSIRKSKLIQ